MASSSTYTGANQQPREASQTDVDGASMLSFQTQSTITAYPASHRSESLLLQDESDATPRASLSRDEVPSDSQPYSQGHDGQARPRYGSVGQFRSEDAYLDALRSWAEAKQYYKPGELSADGSASLEGFYGKTTLEDYASRPKPKFFGDLKKNREAKQRRTTVDESARPKAPGDEATNVDNQKRRSSIVGNLLRKQRTR